MLSWILIKLCRTKPVALYTVYEHLSISEIRFLSEGKILLSSNLKLQCQILSKKKLLFENFIYK